MVPKEVDPKHFLLPTNAAYPLIHFEKLLEVWHLVGFSIISKESTLGWIDALVFYIMENLGYSPNNLKKIENYLCKTSMLDESMHLDIFKMQRGKSEDSMWEFLMLRKPHLI